MIWPFLMIYASETLGLPLAAVASLLAVLAFWWLQARAARDVTIIS